MHNCFGKDTHGTGNIAPEKRNRVTGGQGKKGELSLKSLLFFFNF